MDEDLKMISSTKDLSITVSKDQKVDCKDCSPGCKSTRMLLFLKRNNSGDLNKESLKLLKLILLRKS